MIQAFASARLWLAQIDPLLPAALLVVLVFGVVYSVRRWWPRAWLALENVLPFASALDFGPIQTVIWKAWQALPGMLLGAAVAAMSTGGDVRASLWGVASGVLASLAHEVMAAYKGQVSKPKPATGAGALGAALTLCFVLLASGCALLKGPVTPKSIDTAAVILCDNFFHAQKPGMSAEDIEKAFCSAARDLEPFLLAAKRAQEQGGAVALHRSESAQ